MADTVPAVAGPVVADIAPAVVVAEGPVVHREVDTVLAVVDIVPVVVAAAGPAEVGIVLAVADTVLAAVAAADPVEVADTVPAVAAADPVAGSVGEGRATTVAERYAASALTISNTLITRIPTAFAGT